MNAAFSRGIAEAEASDLPYLRFRFDGTTIPDGLGGILISGTHLNPNSQNTSNNPVVYHISVGASAEYPFSVSDGGTQNGNLLLGENGMAFLVRGNTVAAFDAITGTAAWTWQSPYSGVEFVSASADGGVVLQEQRPGISWPDTLTALDGNGQPSDLLAGGYAMLANLQRSGIHARNF